MTSWGVLERLEGLVTHFRELIYFVSDSEKMSFFENCDKIFFCLRG